MSYGSVSDNDGVTPHFSDAELLADIADVARHHLQWTGALAPAMPLVETFELDSLRQLTLVIELENRFRLRLDDEDAESLVTVGDLIALIRRKREQR